MTFCRADQVSAWAGTVTTAVRQAAAKAKLEVLRIMTITCDVGSAGGKRPRRLSVPRGVIMAGMVNTTAMGIGTTEFEGLLGARVST
jgi:hypothetical protein